MITRVKERWELLEQELAQIEEQESDLVYRYKQMLDIVKFYCNEICQLYDTENCYTLSDEIKFFKEWKPLFQSRQYYFTEMLRIETEINALQVSKKKKYFKKELCKLKDHCHHNRHIYKYLRTNSKEFDHLYFTKLKPNQSKYDDQGESTIIEDGYSSLYDSMAAKIKANELLKKKYEDELSIITNIPSEKLSDIYGKAIPFQISNMKWTESKAAAVELLYSLYLTKVFNNGKSDLADYIRYGEQIMGIPLKETFYKTYNEIKQRNDRIRFIQTLSEKLEEKMNSDDEKDPLPRKK